jgi:hypothetical protein
VRHQVTKVLEYITWYTSLVLTTVIVKTWRIMREIYKSMHQHKENAGSAAMKNEAEAVLASAVMIAMESSQEKRTNTAHFNTDATTIGVDNRCTTCISDKKEHFVGNFIAGRKVIKGFHGGKTTKVMSGTIQWKWLDSNGLEHEFKIPGSYYIPDGKCRLLSPQHWVQEQKKATACKHGRRQTMMRAHCTGKEEERASQYH